MLWFAGCTSGTPWNAAPWGAALGWPALPFFLAAPTRRTCAATCGWAGQEACGFFPGCHLPGVRPPGGADGLSDPRSFRGQVGPSGLGPDPTSCPGEAEKGLRGCAQLCLGQGQGPELGPPGSPARESTGLPPVPEGLQTQQLFCHFPFSPDGPAFWAAFPFWWGGMGAGHSRAERGGAVSVSACRASSRPRPAYTSPSPRGTRP